MDFDRRERSQRERTRREDRRLKFYELRDNLYAGVTCSYRYKFHYANGEVQISVNDYTCAPTS